MLYSSFVCVYVAASTNAGPIVFPNFLSALHRTLTIELELEPEPSWLRLS